MDLGDLQEVRSIVCELSAPTLHIVAEPAAAKILPRSAYEATCRAQFVIAASRPACCAAASPADASLVEPEILALAAKVRCIGRT